MSARRALFGLLPLLWLAAANANACGSNGVWVQVLGADTPEVSGRQPSSSYLIWIDGKARILVDVGGGSALNFKKSGARFSDLDVILFTHLDVDHTADLPVLIQASLLEERSRALPIYGPSRNKLMPSTVTFIRALFDKKRGVYRYLGDFVSPLGKGTYKLQPHDVRIKGKYEPNVYRNERVRISAAIVTLDPVPALAWRIQTGGKFVVFSSDTNRDSGNLEWLARETDLLVIDSVIRDKPAGIWRAQYLPASSIARIANAVAVKKLVVTHHTLATSDEEQQMLTAIRKSYTGQTTLANEFDCFSP